jgi:plasmid stabilization system protein ParE
MGEYRFTPQALRDLFDIWDFIAGDNPEAADRVEAVVFRAWQLAADSPFAGTVRADLTSLPVRFWVVQPYVNYLVVYRPEEKPLQIIRILHGARNLPSILT